MIDPDALSPEKRTQILHGAAIVFSEDGYEGASMSRIARESNVSKGTLYNHFESKAELFRSHLEQACRRHLTLIFDPVTEDADLDQALRGIGHRLIAMALSPERRAIHRMVISESESFPELARTFYDSGPRAGVGALSKWIGAQVARGRLAATNIEFAAEQFFALCQTRLWLRYQLLLQDQPSPAEIDLVVNGAVDTFLARYRAPPQ
jgi:AcrR family transcriptional regulator